MNIDVFSRLFVFFGMPVRCLYIACLTWMMLIIRCSCLSFVLIYCPRITRLSSSDSRSSYIFCSSMDDLSLVVYLGFENGTFQLQASTYYTLSPSRIRSADFNGDAAVDFAVMSYYHRDIELFLNHGNGTFYPGPVLDVGDHGVHYSFEFADLDNDGNRDFITTKERTSDLLIFPGNGDGSFRAMKIVPMGADARPRWLSVGDFNGDTRLDLAIVKKGTSSVDILLNKCWDSPRRSLQVYSHWIIRLLMLSANSRLFLRTSLWHLAFATLSCFFSFISS